ncbi:putative secreted protein [Corynebacterium renale]|uniref:Uncharacterized protein with LGFP repeats n=2 Tax=Corynebacterium renale TaxID=1724 RepID=A0A2A9DNN5_9CORY|nr:LGFP repeat-containing protein [Corynebacterium renale]PFG27582.1 uncharacterized protein with LGFP repeats [Corynebacterium renale]SQG63728.1 putative secreted protein [Corynebacterium renale]SQI23018.1 putative secreted protein [Corynebacterium renale]STD01820.1 putative secreted protein [Corynebacterium renale]
MFRKLAASVAAALLAVGAFNAPPATATENTITDTAADYRASLPPEARIQDAQRSPVVAGSGGYTDAEVEALQEEARLKLASAPIRASRSNCMSIPFNQFQVCGAIKDRYIQQGGPTSWLLWPIGPELRNPDGVGARQQFQNGFIYWHPVTGAHAVSTRVAQVWAAHGWEAGPMGYPRGGEVTSTGRSPVEGDVLDGWLQEFQGGTVYRSKAALGGPLEGVGQHVAVVWGAILERYKAIGGPESVLGFPITDELVASDGVGRYQVFQNGMITWHPAYGAWESFGLVHDLWDMRGGTDSRWEYPVGAPVMDPDVPVTVAQPFSGGQLSIAEEFETAGVRDVGGKEVSNLLIEYLNYHRISLENAIKPAGLASSESLATRSARSVSVCPLPDSSTTDFGGISIPGHYNYWACREWLKELPAYGRHDFCTKSPDQFPAPGRNARFEGACARHDLCMDVADTQGNGYGPCNKTLWKDLHQVCSNNYSVVDLRRNGCFDARDIYFIAVTGYHIGNL